MKKFRNSGALENAEYSFIAIVPKPTQWVKWNLIVYLCINELFEIELF